MSTRFNRDDPSVKDDRLFVTDFQVDQGGQDEDLLQIAKDFGCLPCIGNGLVVTSKSESDHKVEVSTGWAYDLNGHRITLESAQNREAELEDTSGGNNYIILSHQDDYDTPRNAHRTGTEYQTRKKDFFLISVSTSAPGINDIVLANGKQTGTGPITVLDDVWPNRLVRTCKLIPHSSIPEVAEEEGTGTGAKPPPPGSKPELPDYPKGKGVAKKVPMPIILHGNRGTTSWEGIETVMPEELGRVPAVTNVLTLERVNLKSGTPLADVLVWIGDWGQGQQDGSNPKKCNFSSVKSGAEWADKLWITGPDDDPSGPGYYYLVRGDESWHSKITDSGYTEGTNWVTCEEDLKDADSHTFYVCPYAERYQEQALPFKTDTDLDFTRPKTVLQYNRIASPVAPVVRFDGLNLGGKYKLKVASVVSSDNYTNWATKDFIVGSDLVVCWYPASPNLNVIPVDGGVEITIPAKDTGEDPEAYELCYTYGTEANPDPPAPEFTNSEHPTIRVKERKFKIDAPPGRKVRVKCRAIRTRMVMRCTTGNKILEPEDTYIVAGGVGLRRNRKIFTNPIEEDTIVSEGTALVDQQKIPNPIWPKSIALFNPTTEPALPQKDFEVYVHGSNQTYTLGRKILIGTGGIATEIAPKGWVEQPISDYRITDPGVMITIKNIHSTNDQSFDLRYTVEYCEDSEAELEKLGQE